jgi:hypothetical protein
MKRGIALLAALAMTSGCAHHDTTDAAATPVAAAVTDQPSGAAPAAPEPQESYPPDTIVGAPIDPHSLSATELRYGIAPKRDPRVTYGDDVIVMEHGDQAIRSAASDGLTWTIDASAPGADQIQEGKVLFATSRAVGRVMRATRNGNAINVVLGPVEITDVVTKGNFAASQPIDLNSAVMYYAPKRPGFIADPGHIGLVPQADRRMAVASPEVRFADDVSPEPSSSPRLNAPGSGENPGEPNGPGQPNGPGEPANPGGDNGAPGGPPPDPGSLPGAPELPSAPDPTIGNFGLLPQLCDKIGRCFHMAPCACGGGLGMKISYKDADLAIDASGALHMSTPHVEFHLYIDHATIQEATVTVYGAAGLHVDFAAASAVGVSQLEGNARDVLELPVDITWPIGGMAVPFAVNVSTEMLIDTAFSTKQSSLSASGDYNISGSYKFGYQNGSWAPSQGPSTIETNNGLANSLDGVSFGVNGLVLAFGVKVLVGIGAFGFATGPYVHLKASGSGARAPSVGNGAGPGLVAGGAGMMPCNQGTFDLTMGGGVGYKIPQGIAAVVNWVLSAANLKEIKANGSIIEITPDLRLAHRVDMIPPGCAAQKGATDS